MSTYTQIIYHIVFSTKDRRTVLAANHSEYLFRYCWGVLKNKNCHLYRINGTEDHIHILTSLHPSIPLSNLIKDIKLATSDWIRKNNVFQNFSNWQAGYGAFTASANEKDILIEYIKSQQEHHREKSFQEELKELLLEAGIEFDEKYLL